MSGGSSGPLSDAVPPTAAADATGAPWQVEANGINVIPEAERKGRPRGLFWVWAASNVSVLGMSWGAYTLGIGVSVGQALLAGTLGTGLSFLLVGLVAIAGKRGSAPTMTLSRAVFGVRGNALPSVVSYLLLVGWETVAVSVGTLATSTVFTRLGWAGADVAKVLAFVVMLALIIGAGVTGFDLIMRVQKWLTLATLVSTAVFVALTLHRLDLDAMRSHPAGPLTAAIGAGMLMFAGFGMGWINCGADYSRYLPRTASSRGIVGWTTFGASLPVVLLLIWGLLLCASDPALATAMADDPVGAMTALVPTWFVLPFLLVALLGLVAGGLMDLYSSGLSLLAMGLRVPRWAAAACDGVLVLFGTAYVVWLAPNFLTPFQGFLITLGVPLAAWGGMFLADMLVRRNDYDAAALYRPGGRYGSVNWTAVSLLVVATACGWGLVTNEYADWLTWQGYLLGPLGLGGRTGDWAVANIGVVVALVIGFAGQLLTGRARVRRQELVLAAGATARRGTSG